MQTNAQPNNRVVTDLLQGHSKIFQRFSLAKINIKYFNIKSLINIKDGELGISLKIFPGSLQRSSKIYNLWRLNITVN